VNEEKTLNRGNPLSRSDNTKRSEFIVLELSPLNGEPRLDALIEAPLTPNDLFFVRNHAPAPVIDPTTFRLTVSGLVQRPLMLSLAELRAQFPAQRIIATLQCAGNRRQELLPYGEIPGELLWGEGAISTAVWEGVSLRAVLEAAGLANGAAHVEFIGRDRSEGKAGFGGSIPLDKALAEEVLLADRINGEPLPLDHGYPLRVVVPGYLGARSVKWLDKIVVRPTPSENYYQTHAYKLFPGNISPETVKWEEGMMLGEMPVTSVICTPRAGAIVRCPLTVAGYALTSGGRRIVRVEVSADQGRTWIGADLHSFDSPWAWTLWRAGLDLPAGEHELVVRAWDSAANTQPADVQQVWNFKGYYNNAWHRVRCRVV
jgi:sulfite oxidase